MPCRRTDVVQFSEHHPPLLRAHAREGGGDVGERDGGPLFVIHCGDWQGQRRKLRVVDGGLVMDGVEWAG